MKTVFITGTSTGLGRAAALYFAGQGWQVAATMRSPEKETELQKNPNIRVIPLDVTDPGQAQRAAAAAIEAFGKIDVVVNNAGNGIYGALELVSEESIDHQYAVNVRGVINVIRAFLPHFRANQGGMFINISSYMGFLSAVPLGSLYNMSKFALEGLTEGLYYELKPHNIQLRLVQLGGFESDFTNKINMPTSETIRDYDVVNARVNKVFDAVKSKSIPLTKAGEIAEQLYAVATGANQQFRVPVGKDTAAMIALRNSLPLAEYLEKVDAMFA
jgi:NAD(P)-dependent dehydrogenase (short-subunit alcohol dehydrogenase family)